MIGFRSGGIQPPTPDEQAEQDLTRRLYDADIEERLGTSACVERLEHLVNRLQYYDHQSRITQLFVVAVVAVIVGIFVGWFLHGAYDKLAVPGVSLDQFFFYLLT